MRALSVALVVVSTVSMAQVGKGGAWRGYVRGWVADDAPLPGATSLQPQRRFPTQPIPYNAWVGQQLVWQQWQAAAAQQATLATLADAERARVEQRAADEARAEQAALVQAELERERLRHDAERLQIERQRLENEQKLMAAQLAAAQRAETERAAAAEAERVAKAEEERKAREAELAARPRTKGPDVHTWVDDEGVVHFSTTPRGAKR